MGEVVLLHSFMAEMRPGTVATRIFAAPVIVFLLLPTSFFSTFIHGRDATWDGGDGDFVAPIFFLLLLAMFFATFIHHGDATRDGGDDSFCCAYNCFLLLSEMFLLHPFMAKI